MTASVRIGPDSALSFDVVTWKKERPAVLLSIGGTAQGLTESCCLIPVHLVETVIASLRLVAKQAKEAGRAVPLS